jgi:glycosyltransferase involved in cell wall biosynthesis
MRAGCPVVANATGSLPEIVGAAGVVRKLAGPEDLAVAICGIIEDTDMRAECVRRGIARAKLFDWEDTAARTLAAYRSVAPVK